MPFPKISAFGMDATLFDQTIGAIYDIALAPGGWQGALDRLGQLFRANIVTVIERDLVTMNGRAVAIGVDEASQREYFDVWRDRNVFVQRTHSWNLGEVVTDQDLLSKDELRRSDYFNGFLKPRDMNALLRISLRSEGPVHQSISIMRPPIAGEFERGDVAIAQRFVPHLQRAAMIGARLHRAQLLADATIELLDDNPTGIVVLERGGRVGFVNRDALAMAERGDGLVLRGDGLHGLRPSDDDALSRLVQHAIAEDRPRCGGAMRLPRRSGLRDYVIVVSPLARDVALIDGAAPIACILISDPETSALRPRSVLREVYGLTAAETRLAERLLMGERPDQAATALGIKISTTREHLAALFRKTATSGQADLVRLLLSLPWREGKPLA